VESAVTRTVLAIDTATPAVIAAVVRRDDAGRIEVLAQRITVDAHAHAEQLTPNIVAAVADAGLTMAGIDAVVVGCGPGPFTGLRIGRATAAAFGHALGIPVHGVCSLDAIGGETAGEVLVVTDARRREVYWARYSEGVRTDGPGVGALTALEVDGAELLSDAQPSPVGLVAAVGDWESEPLPLVPLYLRRPDAKTLAERAR
jgi:tRNA threonylcarbamoyl adenosine modification protein YeaZ